MMTPEQKAALCEAARRYLSASRWIEGMQEAYVKKEGMEHIFDEHTRRLELKKWLNENDELL